MFEREVCEIFTAALNPPTPYKRNMGQARDGGNDIDIEQLIVECKRRKTLGTVYKWLQQAIDAAKGRFYGDEEFNRPMIPVVVARQDADTSPLVILRLNDFIALTRDELRADG